jgi:hypothetical protein
MIDAPYLFPVSAAVAGAVGTVVALGAGEILVAILCLLIAIVFGTQAWLRYRRRSGGAA